MKQIRWYEKYGLGTIDIVEQKDNLSFVRYEISMKLYEAIKQYVNLGHPFMSKEPKDFYYNPRISKKGKAISFSIRTQYGVAGIISDGTRVSRERNLSQFSKYVARHYSK